MVPFFPASASLLYTESKQKIASIACMVFDTVSASNGSFNQKLDQFCEGFGQSTTPALNSDHHIITGCIANRGPW
jgi:hypothetical protein